MSLLGHVWIHVTFGNIKKSIRPGLIPYPPNVKTKNHKSGSFNRVREREREGERERQFLYRERNIEREKNRAKSQNGSASHKFHIPLWSEGQQNSNDKKDPPNALSTT